MFLVKEFVTSSLSGCSLKISQLIQNAANKSADRNEKAKQLVYLWFLEFLKVEREAELQLRPLKTETETLSTFRTTLISCKSYK